ncbi:DUF1559 family PulG-like putative transporter [Aureliella helgolandensis]|uniref:DUF1559 family PulG-like putative transporter n=1 Tax=Aureliella helgolandensis TaxID=2527968 RepID=UPI0018D15C2B|nr:DUF1559 domain-containing protein [Aureliella helgolandensis]
MAGQKGPCANCGKVITIPRHSSVETEVPPTQASEGAVVGEQSAASERAVRAAVLPVRWVPLLLKAAGLLAGVTVLSLVALSLLWPVLSQVRGNRHRALCMTNLQRIASALNAYAAEYGTYPPPVTYDAQGQPMCSWRVLILPQLGETALYQRYRFDQAWDSVENAQLFASCPAVYISPARDDPRLSNEANYVLLTGSGTLFPPEGPLAPSGVLDGPSQTLLVAEVKNSIAEWSKPWDIDTRKMTAAIGGSPIGSTASGPTSLGGNHQGGATAAMADGQAVWLPAGLAPEILNALISPAGGEPLTPAEIPRP